MALRPYDGRPVDGSGLGDTLSLGLTLHCVVWAERLSRAVEQAWVELGQA